MQVREAMSTDCQTVKMHDSLRAAAEHMRDDDIGMLLVEDDGGGIRGILTDRDIAVRAVASGVGPDEELASCVTEGLVACHEDDNLEDALRLMEQEQVRRLLVRDSNERPVGVLAQADVARAMGRSELVGETLQEISQPGGDHSQH
jgi:CBS domain-containing protein